jgi:hypothetical protein
MASSGTVEIKIPADIEYRVIGNAFGLLIACGGLLGGAMVSQHSLEYWQEDIVPLGLILLLGYRLMRNILTTVTACQGAPLPPASPVSKENIQRVHAAVAQLPEAMNYTTEQVIEEVAKRIEAQKANAARRAVR